MLEEWRPIVDCEGLYEVSDLGNVRSFNTKGARSNRAPADVPALLKQSVCNAYRTVRLSVRGRRKQPYVHHLVLVAFKGQCPPKHEGAHLDGHGDNNKLSNLVWATKKENEDHKEAHGTRLRGAKSPSAYFTNEQIYEIRKLCKAGKKHKEIAELFGVARVSITCIARNKHYFDQSESPIDARRTNKHGYPGVYKSGNKWGAHIRIDGQTVYLGSYITIEEAAAAYQEAKRERDQEQ